MTTATETELTAMLKDAMRARDKRALAAIRMIRTKILEKKTSKNAGEITDDVVVGIIRAYVKGLQGALEEFRAGGTTDDDENIVQLSFEIDLFDHYMPKFLDEDATRELVHKTLEEAGITDPKMAGRATGMIMKGHKGQVDPGLVNRLIRAKLGA